MAFGLFKKYCQICERKVNKSENIVRFGKDFCSEDHANEYVEEQKKIESLERQIIEMNKLPRMRSNRGCCG